MAISKQQQAKERQEYNPNPIIPVCKNCLDLEMREERNTPEWRRGYEARSFPFCKIGGFSVKMMGTCQHCRTKEGI
jgi:hypothetical protein